MAILVGSTAPDFSLPGWYNQSEARYSLTAERGHPVVLAFYPGDERLVCTRQMCAYSDSVADLHLFDAVVWGISPQDLDSHQSFAEGRRLKMPLLCDVDREVARAYGVLGPMGLRRSVFVVDAGGRIAWRRVVSLNVLFPAVAEIRAALEDVRAAA
jgi:thioredoxin-dependent peroxiredoxin